jgi:hypothetical protein
MQKPEQPINSPAACARWNTTRAAFAEFHQGLDEKTFPAHLPSKEYLSGALKGLEAIKKPSLYQVSEAATLFQFRKCIQSKSDQGSDFKGFAARITRPRATPSTRFQNAARVAVRSLGRQWDKTYLKHVESTLPTFKANLEHLRPDSNLADLPFDAAGLRDICLGLRSPVPIPAQRDFLSFKDGGKTRQVTIPSFLQLQLGPLASTLYDALVRTGAVLRGPASPSNLPGMVHDPSEVFVSADYKASTDNFEMSNTFFLIELLRETSTRIPAAIFDLCHAFMGPCLIRSDHHGAVFRTNGQLMGDRPSFPFLCLTNLTGLYMGLGTSRTRALIKSGLAKVNGDDTVFRCKLPEFQAWKAALPEAGLCLEETKTLVHERVLTLNSTFLLARSRQPRLVWFLKASSLLKDAPAPNKDTPPREALYLQTASFLSSLTDSFSPLCNCPAVIRSRFHLLRARHRLCRPVFNTCPPPPGPNSQLPPPWRRLARALRAVSSTAFGRPAKPLAPLATPLPAVTTAEKPRHSTQWSIHRVASQDATFRRRRPAPKHHLTIHPDRPLPAVRFGQQWSSLPPSSPLPLHIRNQTGQGLGYTRPPLFYTPTPLPLRLSKTLRPLSAHGTDLRGPVQLSKLISMSLFSGGRVQLFPA